MAEAPEYEDVTLTEEERRQAGEVLRDAKRRGLKIPFSRQPRKGSGVLLFLFVVAILAGTD